MPFTIVRDDLARFHADALVNAANEQLRRGGGVCGALFEAAGARKLQRACDRIGHCDTGSAVATRAYGLPARYVIHAVGPVWQGGNAGERELLASCYRTSLELAQSLGCHSIAFPLISAGIYGYPAQEALAVAQQEIRTFLEQHEMDVTLVLYDPSVMRLADDLRLRVERYIDDVYVGEHARVSQRLDWERQQQPTAPHEAEVGSAPAEESSEFADQVATDAMVAAPHACPHCGSTVTALDSYCPRCGHPLRREPAAERPAAAARPSISLTGPAPQAPSHTVGTAHPRPRKTSAAPRGGHLPHPLRTLLDHLDAGFSETLLAMIDERGLTDAQVYKRANISRQHFSKMRSNPRYQPKKTTVLALAVALELSLEDTTLLLERAGFALSHADRRDVIVEFFIREGIYDVFQINEALFAFDQPLLG